MLYTEADWRALLSFLGNDVRLILLKGYSRFNRSTEDKDRYKNAKIPYSPKQGETVDVSIEEVERCYSEGHWLGLKIPEGYSLVDCDDKETGEQIAKCLMQNNVRTIIFKTHNGYQYLFRDTERKIKKQNTKQITLGGSIVDYRIPPNGYTVLPTPNIPERKIIMPQADTLDEIMDIFLPVRGAKKEEADKLSIPIFEGERDTILLAHACRLNNYKSQHRMNFDAVNVLHQINNLFVEPPLDDKDIEKLYRSSQRYSTPEPLIPEGIPEEQEKGFNASQYFINPEGHLCRVKRSSGETSAVRLANFDARIEREVLEDNGVEKMIKYMLTGEMKDRRLPEIEVLSSTFPSMNWVSLWGARAVIEPGQGTKDYVRHAIQSRSVPQQVTSYAHTGWRKIDGQWAYLTHSGAIGIPDITVRLPKEAQRYCLPIEAHANEREAVHASLSFLTVAKKEITIPLYASMWLSTLTTILKPMPNFSLYSYGDSGSQKSTLAVLLQSHWGEFDINCLSNFNDTANQLTERAFKLKDALMVVDDFHPEASRKTSEDKERILQRLIRDFSNRTGRGRLNADSTEKERHEPRGFLLVTAEELPRVQSTIARTLVVEFKKGDVDMRMLTGLQNKAHLLPYAMTSWLRWLSHRIDSIRESFPVVFGELRAKALTNGQHSKLPEQIAYLHYVMTLVSQWMRETGVLNEQGAEMLLKISWETLTGNMGRQSEMVQAEDPVNIFMETLETLIIQGKVLIKNRLIDEHPIGDAKADFIGWYDDELEWLHLNPMGTWNAIKRYLDAQGTHFSVSKNTLYKMLKNKGLSNPKGEKSTSVVKVKDEGDSKSQRVLELKITDRLKEAMLTRLPFHQMMNIVQEGR